MEVGADEMADNPEYARKTGKTQLQLGRAHLKPKHGDLKTGTMLDVAGMARRKGFKRQSKDILKASKVHDRKPKLP